jgi:hypothetical protein
MAQKKWNEFNGRTFEWCEHCECVSLYYECCGNSSCNCGGCEKCEEDDEAFSKSKYKNMCYTEFANLPTDLI